MADDQKPIGKIDPVKKPARPDQRMADEASPVQQKLEKPSLVEAMAARTESIFITDDEDLPVSKHYILWGIAIVFFAFILWANWATLDEVTRGQGTIIPSGETRALQSFEGGIVDEFLVREGEEVQEGQVLLRLRDVQAASDLGANQQRYYGLLAKTARLEAEAQGLDAPSFSDEVMQNAPQTVTEEMSAFRANRDSLRSQKSVLDQQLNQRRQEIREIETRIRDAQGLLSIAREEKNMIEPLVARGSAPQLELLQLERSIRERQAELNNSRSSLPRARSALEEAQARLDEIDQMAKTEAQTELTVTLIELNSIRETLGALEDRKTRTDIRSPVNGFVQDIKVNTIGGVVRAGEDVIEIVPLDEKLLVEAKIRPEDIGFLHPGMPATVKITAYDFSVYGGLDGEVLDISPDAIQDEQGNVFYRVRVQTEENRLRPKSGKDLPIKVGMITSVDILTGDKTVMDYILKPILKTVDNSMNER